MPLRRACRSCGRSCKTKSTGNWATPDREVFVTSGTSGGIMLAMLVLLNPGEEVIVFDPYFMMYDALAGVAGRSSFMSTRTPISASTWTRRGGDHAADEVVVFNSPANPTGVVATEGEVAASPSWRPSGTWCC